MRMSQPIRELEGVAHVEPVDEDVDRPLSLRVDEVQLLVSIQGVVLLVGEVAGARHELGKSAAILRSRGQVDVPALAVDPRSP